MLRFKDFDQVFSIEACATPARWLTGALTCIWLRAGIAQPLSIAPVRFVPAVIAEWPLSRRRERQVWVGRVLPIAAWVVHAAYAGYIRRHPIMKRR